ncbi:unnamed protein product, partial [Polarella glacialis]
MADAEEVPTCLVLGAGVQSLTCALCLHARGWSVVVLAAGRRAETTSWGAGAIWEYPPFRIEPKESAKRRVCISRPPFEVLAKAPSSSKECGVRLLRSYYCFRDAEQGRKDFEAASDPPDAAPELREGLPPLGALRQGSPHQYAFSYRAPVICMARYLTWLEEKLAELGVQFVVNCLGLGAGEVFQDPAVHGVLGDLVYIRAPALEAELGIGHISDEDHHDGVTYMVSQLDGVEREGGVRHGGSGVVTSWGCAGEVTELASQAAADAGLVLDLAVAAAGGRHTLAAMLPDSRAAVKVCKYAISHHRNNPHSVNTWVFRGTDEHRQDENLPVRPGRFNASLSFNAALSAFLGGGDVRQWARALQLVQDMRHSALLPDAFTYGTLATVCAAAHKASLALDLPQEMYRSRLQPDLAACNALAAAAGLAQQWQQVLSLLGLPYLASLSLRPDITSLGTLLDSLERGRQWQRALQALSEARRCKQPSLDQAAFSSTIAACGKSHQWTQAFHLLSVMKLDRLNPNIVTYNNVIASTE